MKDSVKDDLGNCGLTHFILAEVLGCAYVGPHTELGIAAHSGITHYVFSLLPMPPFPEGSE